MSVKSFFQGLLGTPAGKSVIEFVYTEEQKAIAALRTVKIGGVSVYDTVASDISAIGNSSMTNADKFETVVDKTKPLVAGLLSSNGRNTLVADTESLVRGLVQTVFNDVKSTKASAVAQAILALVGVKL